ncbi:MAG: hypothetical protein KKA19_04715 [Candidatus Margulisbacteria bacterium]|nr:hypothetical protein [Candidatus Margulisiibacteriota bacterium]
MICKLCHEREVKDPNPKIHLCDLCIIEIMSAFTYHIDGKEVTQEEYERRLYAEFKN